MVAKTIFFRVAVEVLLVPYLALAFLERPFRPRLTPLLWSVLAYLGALLMATLTSADPYLSWWGNMTWMEGVFGFLHYVLFFVILAGVLRTKRDWLNFFKVSSIVSFLVAALSVRLGLAFPGPHPRIGSTLGHYA